MAVEVVAKAIAVRGVVVMERKAIAETLTVTMSTVEGL